MLLASRVFDCHASVWDTIGGFLNYGEDPIMGLKREVFEETGASCEVGEFVTMVADRYGPEGTALLAAFFTVHLNSPVLGPKDDVSELCWFKLDQLPENIAFAGNLRALEVLKEKLR